jgi:superfamily II DNA or RNA helicase
MKDEKDLTDELDDKLLENRAYPSPSDPNFQLAIYLKREFQIHRLPERKPITNYQDLKDYRDKKCSGEVKLSETQVLLSNFINPNTPYKGILIFHGTGVGKTCAAVSIAEKFKPMVEKYGTRIHVLVHGPLNKQSFINEILKCSGETYFSAFRDNTLVMDEEIEKKIRKNAITLVSQYYRIMSYSSFYKRVLGERIKEKVITGNKVKITNRRTETGEIERDISIDRIYDLNNGLLIIDEAHNVQDNEWGDAVKKIIENSTNLRVVLMSATPAKNLAGDIIDLINFLRPKDSQIQKDKVFTSKKNSDMEFKQGGREYLRKMVRGYVSYLRGNDPLTFAERVDMGEIPPGLDFTRVTRCFMYPFQLKIYNSIEFDIDSLYRTSHDISNFVFPGLSKNGKDIEGYYGIEGMAHIRSQLKTNGDALRKKIASTILAEYSIKDVSNLLYLKENGKIISGDIFKQEYLKHFSIKFYEALKKINETVYGKRDPGLIFVFTNLVQVGVVIFREVLENNGYLEYQENYSDYNIQPDTRCYFCEYTYENHSHLPKDIPKHKFHPATFISITGKTEDTAEQIPEEKMLFLRNVFNNPENKDGKFVKIILGSTVMNEGITLKNIKEIHILDVRFTLTRTDQTIGRGIRFCTHYDLITEDNPFPKVEIYKYVISLKGKLSSEEELYRKAEKKYLLIKETERILQEEAIDCPLNMGGNIFQEELDKYQNCGTKDKPCPAICGYLPCVYKCGDKLLNSKYYDPNRHIYRKVAKSDMDYSTYSNVLAREEIDQVKSIIKEMFYLEHVYTLEDILEYAKRKYPPEKLDMFDDYYVYQALDELIPITNNDFNNFHDTITDKFNRPGYLIYRSKYYIFQPFNENENLPMYYRRNYDIVVVNNLGIKNYLQSREEYKNYREKNKKVESVFPIHNKKYNYDINYYDSREEFEYVGIIDREAARKKTGKETINDVFKIRQKRPKILEKKRETGVASFLGSVCAISKQKNILIDIAKSLKLNVSEDNSRIDICEVIKNRLYDLEKYGTSEKKNKMTYLIIPTNHADVKKYPWPLNLEDRIKFILNEIQQETKMKLNPEIRTIPTKGNYSDINYVRYEIVFDSKMDNFKDVMKIHDGNMENNKWIILIE